MNISKLQALKSLLDGLDKKDELYYRIIDKILDSIDSPVLTRGGGWNDDIIAELVRLQKLGYSHKEIGERLGKTTNSISVKLSMLGIKR